MQFFAKIILAAAISLAFLFQATTAGAAQVYRVTQGETLYKIALNYEIELNEIVLMNNLAQPDNLFPGQVLIIPAREVGEVEENGQEENNLYTEQQSGTKTSNTAVNDSRINKSWVYNTTNLARDFGDIFILSGPSGINKIALTFDDGPDPVYTAQVLDVLKSYNVPATFFLIGQNALKYPDVVAKIHHEGHIIGNHSWSHPNLIKLDLRQLNQEIVNTESIIEQITGLQTALIRPPYGSIDQQSLHYINGLGYKTINWSVDSNDWRDQDVDQILINTLPDVKDGSIILMHSTGGPSQNYSATVKALPEIIYTLQVQGYTFVTLDELLSIPAYKQERAF